MYGLSVVIGMKSTLLDRSMPLSSSNRCELWLAVLVAEPAAGRIDEHDLAGLGVLQLDQAHLGHGHLHAVADRHGDHVVTLVQQAQRLLEAGLDEVRDQEDRRPLLRITLAR